MPRDTQEALAPEAVTHKFTRGPITLYAQQQVFFARVQGVIDVVGKRKCRVSKYSIHGAYEYRQI